MSWTCTASDTMPRAARTHRCCLCGEIINIGETYVRRFGYGDEGPVTMHMHSECEEIAQKWDQADWESCMGDLERPKKEVGA